MESYFMDHIKRNTRTMVRKTSFHSKDINENGPEEFRSLELIRIEELQAIRRIWVNDKHEFDDALPKIYEKY